jgi:putative oxidoreductase
VANAGTSRVSEIALNLLRIAGGFLFVEHGLQKILGLLGGFGPEGGPAPTGSIYWVAGMFELVGGTLIALGLFTRPVAFLCSGEMATAYFLRHAPNGFWPMVNHGELPALYSFLWLFIAANGGGRFSLDGLLFGRRERA